MAVGQQGKAVYMYLDTALNYGMFHDRRRVPGILALFDYNCKGKPHT